MKSTLSEHLVKLPLFEAILSVFFGRFLPCRSWIIGGKAGGGYAHPHNWHFFGNPKACLRVSAKTRTRYSNRDGASLGYHTQRALVYRSLPSRDQLKKTSVGIRFTSASGIPTMALITETFCTRTGQATGAVTIPLHKEARDGFFLR